MKEHSSYPHNPYLAEVMYQMGYIEKYGTGITENIRRMQAAHLLAPEIDLSTEFITTIWRDNDATNDATDNPNVATNLGTNIGTNDATHKAHNPLTDSTNIETNIGTNIGTSDNNIGTSSSNDATFSSNDATPRPNDATSQNVSADHIAENKRIIDDSVKPKVKLRMTNMQIRELIIEACIVEHSVEELAQLLHKSVTHIRNRFITDMVADGILLRTKPSHSLGQTYFTNPKLDRYKKITTDVK